MLPLPRWFICISEIPLLYYSVPSTSHSSSEEIEKSEILVSKETNISPTFDEFQALNAAGQP